MNKNKKLISRFTALALVMTFLMSFAVSSPAFAYKVTGTVTDANVTIEPASNAIAKKLGPMKKKDWTVAIYMCGSDLESKYSASTNDLIEMIESDIPDNVNVIVMTGGALEWNPEGADQVAVAQGLIAKGAYLQPDKEHTQLYSIANHKMNLLHTYSENLDMSKTETVAELMEFAIAYAPAEHMMFSFWDHGGGPILGAELDEYKKEALKLPQIAAVINAGAKARGKKFDIIGYDCCLMACLENAWILSGAADYLLASEESEPGTGWMYHWLNVFSEKKDVNAVDIGRRVIDLYPVGSEHGWMDSSDLTLSLVDLSKIPALVNAVDAMSKELNDALKDPEKYALIARRAEEAHSMFHGKYGVSDIYDFADKMSDLLPSTASVIEAVGTNPKSLLGEVPGDGAVVYRGVTLDYQDCVGLTIYYPVLGTSLGDIDKRDERAEIYRKVGPSESYIDYIESITSKTGALQSFTGNLLLGYEDATNSIFAYAENPASVVSLKKVTMSVHYIDKTDGGEKDYLLGELPVDCKWDENRFYGEQPTEWFALNGEVFSYESADTSIGDAKYVVPALVKGNDTLSDLEVLYVDGKYMINSVTDIDEDGNPGRSYEPEPGFTFSTVLKNAEDDGEYRANTPVTVDAYQEIHYMGNALEAAVIPLETQRLSGGANTAYDSYFCGYDMKGNKHFSEPVRSFMVEDMSDLHIGEISPQIYNGKAVEPTPDLFFSDETTPIMLDDEFTVTYENNDKPGTATVIVDFVDSVTGVSGRLTSNFEIVNVGDVFSDVPENAPYLEALSYLYGKKIVNGTDEGKFSPENELTRAMVVKMFYELMGAPAPKDTESFTDVPQDMWYTNAIGWAKETGIVNGVDVGIFAPDQNVTREQLATMLARFAEFIEIDVSPAAFGNIYRNYSDAAQISDYAFEAVRWACGKSMLSAVSGNKLAPLNAATRAQTAEAIYRFILNAKEN